MEFLISKTPLLHSRFEKKAKTKKVRKLSLYHFAGLCLVGYQYQQPLP